MPDDMFRGSSETIVDPLQRRLGRRQFIKASAWATPVLALAAAVPAAAASCGAPVTSIGAKALVLQKFTVDGLGDCSRVAPPVAGASNNRKQISGDFALRYDYAAWGAAWDEPAPDSISVTYALKIDDTTLLGPTEIVIPKCGSIEAVGWHLDDLPSGVHRVGFAATATSQTIQGRTYTVAAVVIDAAVTVRD